MRKANTCLAAAALAGLFGGSLVYAQTPVIDGTRDASYGTAAFVQTVNTGFGNNQSELDAVYTRIENGKLYLMLTGNLESNNNKMVMFFDTRAGGQNVMRSDNPNIEFDNLNVKYQGMTFDAAFSPDYVMWFNRSFDSTNNVFNAFMNFSELNTNGGGFGAFLGTITTQAPNQNAIGTFGGTGGAPAIGFGYDDSNIAGIIDGSDAADPVAAADVSTGGELVIDLPQLGALGDFKLMIGINGQGHDFWSNQFAGGMQPPQGNLGSDGLGNFIPPGSVSLVNFNNFLGDQFINISYTAPLSEWDNAGNGNWSAGANWTNDTVPNAIDGRALLGSVAGAAPRTVTLDTNVRLQSLTFDSTGGYTIAPSGGNVLTIAGNPATPSIVVLSGNHAINAPLTLAATTNVSVAAGAVLTTTDVSAQGQALVKTEGGIWRGANFRADSLNVAGGTAAVLPNGGAGGTSKVNALIIAGGDVPTAQLDITNNGFVLEYTQPPPPPAEGEGNSPLAETRTQIIAGRAGGSWTGNGITSSTAAANSATHAIGYAEASDVIGTAGGTFMGQDVDGTAVVIRYTRLGDADLTGTTDIGDFARLAANFNVADTGWSRGDFNYDGITDIGDFSLLASQFNQSAGDLPRSSVPEPAAAGLLGLALAALRRRRA